MSIRIREYKFFRSLSVKVNDNWPVRKAEQIWRQLRAHKIAEIEALEACKWLRAAGFPQYAQLYEDQQFPVDISAVEQDHPMLEASVMKSLFRRLQALNRCANVHQQKQTPTDDEEETCALSENWTYQSDVRRWSRVDQLEMPANIDEWHRNVLKKQATKHQSVRDRLGIFGAGRRRRARGAGGEGSPVLDFLSRQIGGMSTAEVAPLEAGEARDVTGDGARCRSRKARSFDRADRWTSSPSRHAAQQPDRASWRALSTSEEWDDERFDLEEGGRPIGTLACTQLHVLRKLALLKLTAHMEKCCPTHRAGWNWEAPKVARKPKAHAYRERSVFGVPLTVVLQRTGAALPKGVEEALAWLQQSAYDQVGLFRKSGVKSRIAHLRQLIETQAGDSLNFSEYQAHDIADVIKQYFRELPEALLTNQLSQTFMLIFQFVPEEERRQAVLCAMLLMPDEHCEILLVLLRCLGAIAENAAVNQMNESNLAVCFAPSLFHYASRAPGALAAAASAAAPAGDAGNHERELAEHRAAHECLLYLLRNCGNLFKVPREFLQQCASAEMKETSAPRLAELGPADGGWRGYVRACQEAMVREAREKDWTYIQTHNPKVEISYKKIGDGYPLRMWRLCCEIDAPPGEVLYRVLRERPKWDRELHSTRTLAQLDKNVELFQYARRRVGALPMEEYCVMRAWRTDLPAGTCLIIETSVEDPEAVSVPNSVRGVVLASRYLIEVHGGSKSRLTHFSRIDTRGRMPEWYHSNYAHICAIHVANLQRSFKSPSPTPAARHAAHT